TLDVADLTRQTVIANRRPFAVAMAALIQRNTVIIRAQGQAYQVPGMRIEAAAVQEQNRVVSDDAPVEIMKAHPVDHHIVVLGQGETGYFEPSDLGGQLQVLELF